jgi:hypothetical protein
MAAFNDIHTQGKAVPLGTNFTYSSEQEGLTATVVCQHVTSNPISRGIYSKINVTNAGGLGQVLLQEFVLNTTDLPYV